ncbi:MAG: hypothetical protein ACK4SR_10875 [Thiobacillus sp.]
MNTPVIRLSPTHKRLVYAAFVLAWASGALWLAFHYFLGVEGDFGPEAHPLEKWWLRLHGLTAMFALVAIGSLATHHMRLAWNRRRNRATGLPLLALAAWLAATGYALYYFSSDANAAWLPLLHWVAGLAAPLALAAHIGAGRRRSARPPGRPHAAHTPVARTHAAPYPAPARQKASP